VTVPPLDLNTNMVSFTMWIKPSGPQNEYTGLFVTRSGTLAGVSYGGAFSSNAGQLTYSWNNNSTWVFQSGLTIPPDQWSFVAVVIEPTKATLYLYNAGGQLSATNVIPHVSEAWNGNARIGADAENVARTFNGVIDEVAVFNYALTPAQVLNLYNGAAPPSVTLNIQRLGSNLQLSWSQGTLLEATNVTGPWSTNNAAPSPYPVTPAGPQKFYQLLVGP
jgi:hypothetical protein